MKENDFSEANSQTVHNITDWSLEKRRGKIYTQKSIRQTAYTLMHVLERSRSLSCTHIVTRDFKLIDLLLPSSPSFQIKCINATSYELHINVFNIKYSDYFFIKSTFFSPLIDALSAMVLHQPSKYRAIFGASDWLIVHSKKEWNFGSLDTRVRFARDREWPAERFFRSFWAKTHSIRVK